MESLTKFGKRLKHIAGGLGLLQGTAWIAMSVLCITFHYGGTKHLSSDTYMDRVEVYIYSLFVKGDGFRGQLLKPNVFIGFMWAYLVIDVIWVLVSFNLLSKTKSKVTTPIKLWTFVTSLVSFLDVVLVILLGVDYQKCSDLAPIDDVCANGILPVLTIAAKGFILWIVNVIFVYILVKIYKTPKRQPIVHQVEHPNFHASIFSPSPIPHVNTQRPPNGYPQYYQYPPSAPVQQSDYVRMQRQMQANYPTPVQQSDYVMMQRQMQSNYPYQQPFVLDSPPRQPR